MVAKWGKKGRPALIVRLPEEVFDLLKERAEEMYGPVQRGKSGGASRLVRSWVYRELGLEEPPDEWGETDTPTARYQRERRARLAAEEHERILLYLRRHDRFAHRTSRAPSPGTTRIRDKKTGEAFIVRTLEELQEEEARRRGPGGEGE